jgi:hypothetical protein
MWHSVLESYLALILYRNIIQLNDIVRLDNNNCPFSINVLINTQSL